MRAKTAERILLGQAVLVGGLALALFVKEIPGVVREVRIWRMVCPRGRARRPR